MTTALVIGLASIGSTSSAPGEESGASFRRPDTVHRTAVHGAGAAYYRKPERCPSARKGLRFYRQRYAHWQHKRGSVTVQNVRQPRGCADARWLVGVWKSRANIAHQQFVVWFTLTMRKWSCIHAHEGAWNSNTGNGYYGGLQMTPWFQQTYGPEFWRRWGYAHRWPVWAQLRAAERAWRECACFRQWGTAGTCGLA